jgi:hypothetical protein
VTAFIISVYKQLLVLQVPVFAMVMPRNGSQPTGRSRALFNLSASTDCPPSPDSSSGSSNSQLASTDSLDPQVQLSNSRPSATTQSAAGTFRWVANSVALPADVTVQHGQATAVKFNVSWERVPVGNTGAAAASESCAEVVAGLMLSPALSVQGAAGPMQAETFKVCKAGYKLLSQPVGPFPADACGKYTVRLATTVMHIVQVLLLCTVVLCCCLQACYALLPLHVLSLLMLAAITR